MGQVDRGRLSGKYYSLNDRLSCQQYNITFGQEGFLMFRKSSLAVKITLPRLRTVRKPCTKYVHTCQHSTVTA